VIAEQREHCFWFDILMHVHVIRKEMGEKSKCKGMKRATV